MKTDARICDVCGTMFLVNTGCTLCNPNIRREVKKTKRQKKDDGTGAREAETRANEKTARASADRVGQMKFHF